jgi:amino acid transporter
VGGPGAQHTSLTWNPQELLTLLFFLFFFFSAGRFWLSTIKVLTLTGLIILALIIDLGGVPGQERIGFRYWQDGKAFKPYKTTGDVGKFLGFVNALVLALFAYMGTELIGVTVGEAKVSPREVVRGGRRGVAR